MSEHMSSSISHYKQLIAARYFYGFQVKNIIKIDILKNLLIDASIFADGDPLGFNDI